VTLPVANTVAEPLYVNGTNTDGSVTVGGSAYRAFPQVGTRYSMSCIDTNYYGRFKGGYDGPGEYFTPYITHPPSTPLMVGGYPNAEGSPLQVEGTNMDGSLSVGGTALHRSIRELFPVVPRTPMITPSMRCHSTHTGPHPAQQHV